MKKSFKKLISTTFALLLLANITFPNNSINVVESLPSIDIHNIVDDDEIV